MRPVSKNLTTLKWFIYLLIVIIGSSPFLYFWWPESEAFFRQHEILTQYGGVSQLETWQQILGFFVTVMPAALLCWALFLVLKLIDLLQVGKWFDEVTEGLCRKFSKTLLWFAVLQFLHRTLLVLVITITNPPGERQLAINFSTDDVFAMVAVVFALIFAHFIALAREHRDELKQIV